MQRGWSELLAGSQKLRLFFKTASAALLGCLSFMAGPALANSSANANADIIEPLRQQQGGALAGDEKFQQLFASRSEEHTSELQSLMRISYAVFCLKTKKINNTV